MGIEWVILFFAVWYGIAFVMLWSTVWRPIRDGEIAGNCYWLCRADDSIGYWLNVTWNLSCVLVIAGMPISILFGTFITESTVIMVTWGLIWIMPILWELTLAHAQES